MVFALISLPEGAAGTASRPVILGSEAGPQVQVNFASSPKVPIRRAFMDEVEVTPWLETRSPLPVGISNATKVVGGMGLACVFHLLRGIVRAVVEKQPFSAKNGTRIRRLGYTVLALAFLMPLAQYLAAMEILKRLARTIPPLRAGPTFDAASLLGALFLLLLAHVWSYGIELETERALTV